MIDIIKKFSIELKMDEKDFWYLYNDKQINSELTLNEIANENDKNKKKMNIIINKKNEDNNKKIEIYSKDIICPECKESILIDIKDFKINLYGCKNNHKIDNIILNKYEETQKVDLTKIVCNICNKNNKNNCHDNEFYRCNTSNKNLCSLCFKKHDKKHIIINYDEKNYICGKHNESFIQYCKTCKNNICIVCGKEHKNHDILNLGEILVTKDELVKIMENLKNEINNFKSKVKTIKDILNRIIDLLELYYKINNDIINNYNKSKRNYNLLQNLNYLKNNNEILIKSLNDTINMDKIYEFSIDKFYNEFGEKYIGEMKNNVKDGKGILYFKKNENNINTKYEGYFRNDLKEGKGTMFYIDGDKYEGDWKNDIREGKGIYYYNNGDKYDGDWKNNQKEGKGIFYYNNVDKYDGDWKNNQKEGKGIFYYKNGDKFEGGWKNGERIPYYCSIL